MKQSKSIAEHGTIYQQAEGIKAPSDTLSAIYLPPRSFEHLKQFVAENTDESVEIERAFSYHCKRRQEYIKVKNYVGLIETKDGTSIEILPKIYRNQIPETPQKAIQNTRHTFLKMLRCLRNAPFATIGNAHLKTQRFPILEVFITAFCTALDKLLQKGIQKNYITQTANEPFLKGKLLFQHHLRHNLMRQDRFYVQYDHFQENIPHNRLIKSCLLYLKNIVQLSNNQNHLRRFLFVFGAVPPSLNVAKDLAKTRTANRLFVHYRQTLQWVEVFLNRQSFTNFKGNHLNKALLFPMERIFEDYVGYGFKKYLPPDFQVQCQHQAHFLIDKHKGNKKFKLKPDFVIRHTDFLGVLDTKWKLLDSHRPNKNYGIQQSDMYQLYAYGENYTTDAHSPQLCMIYPKQELFQSELPLFHYNDHLKMKVVPFDITANLESEVQQFVEKYFLLKNGEVKQLSHIN